MTTTNKNVGDSAGSRDGNDSDDITGTVLIAIW
jgi:hypothetical protein